MSVGRIKFAALFAQTEAGVTAVIEAERDRLFIRIFFENGDFFSGDDFGQLFVGVAQTGTITLLAGTIRLKREVFRMFFTVVFIQVTVGMSPIELAHLLGKFPAESGFIIIEAVPMEKFAVEWSIFADFFFQFKQFFGSDAEDVVSRMAM